MAHILFEGSPEVAPEEPAMPFGHAFQRIEARPGAFGGDTAAALGAAGQDVTKTANLYGEIAAQQAANNYQDESTKIITDFLSKRGQDAMTAYPQVLQQLNQLRDSGAQGLGLATSLATYNNEVRRTSAYQQMMLGRHYDSESRAWAGDVDKATLANQVAAVAGDPLNEDAFTAALGKYNQTLTRRRQRAGELPTDPSQLTPEGAQMMSADQRHAYATLREAQINALLAQPNGAGTAEATRLFNENQKSLATLPNFNGLAGRIRSHGDSALGDAIFGDAAAGRTPSLSTGGAIMGRGAEVITAPEQYRGLISGASSRYGVPEDLLTRLLSAENGFRAHGVSSAGARGIAQFLDSTAARYGIDPDDPAQAIPGAAHYLADLKAERGSWKGAIDGYLGGNTAHDASYVRNGVPQLAMRLDGGGPPAAGASEQAPPTGVMGVGDSITVGGIRHGGLAGDAVDKVEMPEAALADAAGGRNPQQVLDYVSTHPERFKGQTVFLSTGLMNAGVAGAQRALPLVEQQIDRLKEAGANVVLVGVDQGKFNQYNPALEAIASDKGVPFAGPLPTNDIHPSPQGYRQYFGDALKLAQPGTPTEQFVAGAAQPTGRGENGITLPGAPGAQPAAARQPGQPAVQPIPAAPAPPTTPITPPPGMEDLAQAELQAVTHYERTVAAIEADPRGADNPTAVQRARQRAEQELRSRTLDITARRQILGEQTNAALDGYLKRMAPGAVIDPNMASEIAADPHLGPAARENLYRVLQSREKGSVEQGIATNGPGYFDVRRRMLLQPGDPDRISDPSQLVALGVPDQEGKVWLTDSGIRALMPELQALKKDPGEVQFQTRLQRFFDAAKPLITKANPMMGQLDPEGTAQFYNFQEDAWSRIAAWKAQSKDPAELLNPTNPDFLGSPKNLSRFQTSMQETAKGRAKAITGIPSWPGVNAAPATAPRLPGEAIADYLARTGGLAPPPAATAPIPAPEPQPPMAR